MNNFCWDMAYTHTTMLLTSFHIFLYFVNAGVITAIPDCVLGGMTIFLFANVLTSGINLTSQVDLNSRRNKFIMAWSLAIGVGVSVWPWAFQDMRASPYTAAFWTCADCSQTMQGVRNGVSIFLSTGYCVGTVCAMLLNAILPADAPVSYDEHDPMVVHREKSRISDDGDDDVDETTDKKSPSLEQPEAPAAPSEDGEVPERASRLDSNKLQAAAAAIAAKETA